MSLTCTGLLNQKQMYTNACMHDVRTNIHGRPIRKHTCMMYAHIYMYVYMHGCMHVWRKWLNVM